jgi:hypothetical protein
MNKKEKSQSLSVKNSKTHKVRRLQCNDILSAFRLFYTDTFRLCLLVTLVLFSISPAFAETSPTKLFIRASNLPEKAVWNGQQVMFYVTLSMATRPTGPPLFTVPDVPGGILLAVPGSPVYGHEDRNGVEFITWMYSFTFYPHRAEVHSIPSIKARVNLGSGDGTLSQLTVNTEPFTIVSRLPIGAEGQANLVTTTNLEIAEKWDPDQKKMKVGDAITRTITLRAPNIMGMGFPPLSFESVDGMAIYPKQPEIRDKIYRGDIAGERIENVVYIFEEAGNMTIPSIAIHWFDLNAQALKKVTLPAHQFEVLVNPAFAGGAETSTEPVASIQWRTLLPRLAVLIVLFIISFIGISRLRGPIRKWAHKRKTRIEASEPFFYKQLKDAARSKDAKEVINHSAPWLQCLCLSADVRTLTEFSLRYGDEKFRKSVATLMEQTFGPENRTFGPGTRAKAESEWHELFLNGLAHARKGILKKNREKIKTLSPINP